MKRLAVQALSSVIKSRTRIGILKVDCQGAVLPMVLLAFGITGGIIYAVSELQASQTKYAIVMRGTSEFRILLMQVKAMIQEESSCNIALGVGTAALPAFPVGTAYNSSGSVGKITLSGLYTDATATAPNKFLLVNDDFGGNDGLLKITDLTLRADLSGPPPDTGRVDYDVKNPISGAPFSVTAPNDHVYRAELFVTVQKKASVMASQAFYGTWKFLTNNSIEALPADTGTLRGISVAGVSSDEPLRIPLNVRIDTLTNVIKACSGQTFSLPMAPPPTTNQVQTLPFCLPGWSFNSDGSTFVKCFKSVCLKGQMDNGFDTWGIKCNP